MQPDERAPEERPPPTGGGGFAAGADSSNRPWETDALRIGTGGPPLALGYLAIVAATLLALAHAVLLSSSPGADGSSGHEALGGLPRWQLLGGHYLSILLLPVYVGGYWLVRWGLRSWPVFLLGGYTAVIAAVLHGQLGALAPVAGQPSAAELAAAAHLFSEPLSTLVIALLATLSLWFALAINSEPGPYPRWLAAANPFVLCALFALPALAGWRPALVLPTSFHLGHLVFFALVTFTLRRSAIASP